MEYFFKKMLDFFFGLFLIFKNALFIDLNSYPELIILFDIILPFCLLPIFIVLVPKKGSLTHHLKSYLSTNRQSSLKYNLYFLKLK